MTRVMYDTTTPEAIPDDATAVAGYPRGFVTFPYLVDHFHHANKLSIAIHEDQTDCGALDCENGDVPPLAFDRIAKWVRTRIAMGKPRKLYASRDNIPPIIEGLKALGIGRTLYEIWSAHVGLGPHMCAPVSCGAGFTADATQWTFTALGRNLDESLISDTFFPPAPKRKARPKVKLPSKPHPKVTAATLASLVAGAITTAAHSAGLKIDPAEASGIATAAALVGGYFFPAKKKGTK